MVPLYILGLLQRTGPMHGYRIKKLIAEQLSDFTQIKLPTIYYHLDKMAQNGLISLEGKDSSSTRPEKTIYAITESGSNAFMQMIEETMAFSYHPTFPSDATFFFADTLNPVDLVNHLQTYANTLEKSIAQIKQHEADSMTNIPEEARSMASIIFNHHLSHFHAEYAWVMDTLQTVGGSHAYKSC